MLAYATRLSSDSAQEHEHGTADVTIIVVVGEPLTQMTMQSKQIKTQLHIVALGKHCFGHDFLSVMVIGWTQVVRFPVDHIEVTIVLRDQVYETCNKAVELVRAECTARMSWQDAAADDLINSGRSCVMYREGEVLFYPVAGKCTELDQAALIARQLRI